MRSILERSHSSSFAGRRLAGRSCARLPRPRWRGPASRSAPSSCSRVNLIVSISLRGWKADLTETGCSRSRTARAACCARSTSRSARALLLEEARRGGAGLCAAISSACARCWSSTAISRAASCVLEFFDPEPFSDAEDQAVAAGLRGMRINAEGETGYFGLVATNATDNEATIAFFSPDRERFLEYDITKLIYSLANPKKRVVGLITGLPLDGGHEPDGDDGRRPAAAAVGDHGADPRVLRGPDAEQDVKEIPRRHRRADGGAARQAHAGGGLCDRSVRAQGRQGAGVRRSRRDRAPPIPMAYGAAGEAQAGVRQAAQVLGHRFRSEEGGGRHQTRAARAVRRAAAIRS